MLGNPKVKLFSSDVKKSQLFGGTGRGLDGRLPQVLIKRTLVTQAHRLPPPSPQRSGHSQRLADTCGQMAHAWSLFIPPRGPPHILLQEGPRGRQPGTPAPWTSTWPLLPQGSPKHTGFEGACGLRTCGQWACGGLVQDAGRKVRRGVTHLPHGPITPPPTHLLPRAPSGHVSQCHEAALDTGAVHTEKRLDGVSGK